MSFSCIKKKKPDFNSICLSGGVFQNCSLNRELRAAAIFENLLKEKSVTYSKSSHIAKTAAELLSTDKIIGWFQGQSELGPRALGCRSILADPRGLTMKDRVNEKIKKRESFRPFSPSVLSDLTDLYFVKEINQDTRFMIETVHTREAFSKLIPAGVHVDKSARIQSVSKRDNELFYNLISEFHSLTGIGLVLNKSFNVKDEPIVQSPQDALNTFINANLDYLIIGNYLINRKENLHLC